MSKGGREGGREDFFDNFVTESLRLPVVNF